jgi:hypothetical protein
MFTSRITYLLWALESLCWSPEHLPLAVRVLARLAEIDPGGRTTSRPRDTLQRVLLPMQPYTSAPADLRLQVIDGLRASYPAIWWSLLLDLLPSARHIHMQTYQPEFRDKWIPDQGRIPVIVATLEFFGSCDGLWSAGSGAADGEAGVVRSVENRHNRTSCPPWVLPALLRMRP